MTDEEPVLRNFVHTGTLVTYTPVKAFPARASVGDANVVMHADGRITGATAAEWSAALAKMEGGVCGFEGCLWLILRELQRQEAPP